MQDGDPVLYVSYMYLRQGGCKSAIWENDVGKVFPHAPSCILPQTPIIPMEHSILDVLVLREHGLSEVESRGSRTSCQGSS